MVVRATGVVLVVVVVDVDVRLTCSRIALNSFFSSRWERASWSPVPQSWYATNRRINVPAVIIDRPTPPRTLCSTRRA